MNKKAIVFTHGFLGSNRQFDGVKPFLDGCGADFVEHVIDGHGGSVADFAKSTDASWQRRFDAHLMRLRREYDEIYLVGHSMGGLLSVRAAVARPEKICGIVAVAFPLKVRPRLSMPGFLRQSAGARGEGEDPRITAARELSGVEIKSADEYLKVVPNALRLLRLAKRTREELPGLETPLTVIFAEKDEIVAPDVPEIVREKLPGARVLTMSGAYHFLFGEENQRLIAGEILEMMEGH